MLRDLDFAFEPFQNSGNHVARLDWVQETTQSDGASDDFTKFGFRQCSQSSRGCVELQQNQPLDHSLVLDIQVRIE